VRPDSGPAPILLTGGTSQVGVFALPQLNASHRSVFSLSRRIPPASSQPENQLVRNVLWAHPSAVDSIADGLIHEPLAARVELFLSCGPVQLAAGLLPQFPRLVRLVCVSSSSVYTKVESRDRNERELISGILSAEADLRAACAARKINLVFLRPTMIYGCGLDSNVSRLARWIGSLHFLPVAGKASGLRQPIHAEDVASIAVKALLNGELDGKDVVLKGASTLTYRQMVAMIFGALGVEPRIVSFPPALLAGMLKAASLFPGFRGVNAEFALRQNKDLVFDDDLSVGLQWAPRPFAPTLADFEVPAAARGFQPG